MGTSASGTGKQPPRYPIDSVSNAMRLLSLVAERPAVRVSDVAEELGVAVSTAHRLLSQLEYGEYVLQDEVSRMYRAGPALMAIAEALSPNGGVSRYAAPLMTELAERVGETVSLQVLRGAEVVFLDSIEAPRLLRVGSRAGAVLPAHCVSGGKALLAQLPEERLAELYPPGRPLQRVTDRSITDREVLLAALDKVRRVGYATNFGESEAGVSGVAVVVPPLDGVAKRALAVAAPTSRLPKRRVTEVAEALRETAQLVADELRHAPGAHR